MFSRRSCLTKDTTKRRTAKFDVICPDVYTFVVVLNKTPSPRNVDLDPKMPFKCFRKFWKTLFQTIMKRVVVHHSVLMLLLFKQYTASCTRLEQLTVMQKYLRIIGIILLSYGAVGHLRRDTSEGRTMTQESARELKSLLLIAAANQINSFFAIFRNKTVASVADFVGELSGHATFLELDHLRKDRRNQIIAFKMSFSEHYSTALTRHVFKKNIWIWIGLVNDCYMLHIFSLDSQFVLFDPDFLYAKFNESDEDK